MGELKKRVIAGICLAPVVAFLFYILPPMWLFVLLMCICVIAVHEAASLASVPLKFFCALLVAAGAVFLAISSLENYLLWIMASVIIIIFIRIFDQSAPIEKANRDVMAQIAVVLFSNLFIVMPFFYLYRLKERGSFLPLIVLVSIWASDTFAYFIGKKFGKHPLAPHISPKKTIEGLFGSMLGSLLIIAMLHNIVGVTLGSALIIGAAMGVLGQAGDLMESACKRLFKIKDSSALIPGHGGILDRIDSFIFTAPFLYACLTLDIMVR
ncbi:MAG: phosphatidate cytidylyltransferase [Syntrophorhabdaceae bacterium]